MIISRVNSKPAFIVEQSNYTLMPHSFNFDEFGFYCCSKTYTELKPYIKRHNTVSKVITLIDDSMWDLEDGIWIRR